jgi:hypothetical protein
MIEKLHSGRPWSAVYLQRQPELRIIAMRFLVSALVFLVAAVQLPAAAQSNPQTQSVAAEIEACMRDARDGTKTGQKGGLTPQQRMVAEEQCRARVEAAAQSKKK